jgi:hypothetical protein
LLYLNIFIASVLTIVSQFSFARITSEQQLVSFSKNHASLESVTSLASQLSSDFGVKIQLGKMNEAWLNKSNDNRILVFGQLAMVEDVLESLKLSGGLLLLQGTVLKLFSNEVVVERKLGEWSISIDNYGMRWFDLYKKASEKTVYDNRGRIVSLPNKGPLRHVSGLAEFVDYALYMPISAILVRAANGKTSVWQAPSACIQGLLDQVVSHRRFLAEKNEAEVDFRRTLHICGPQ